MAARKRVLALFDVDGTLTPAREEVSPQMLEFLENLKQEVDIGVVGGSDLPKQKEQLGDDVMQRFRYSFSENGLVAFEDGVSMGNQSMAGHLGEESLQELINFVLMYIANLKVPQKRGTFIEFRTGMLNISPIGRNCSREERNAFEAWDRESGCRQRMVDVLRRQFDHLNLTFSIGGQISFDCFPRGWDKTYCLNHIPEGTYDEIHFFGDKTYEGGNDYEIFVCDRVVGHTVTSPEDTMEQCQQLFLSSSSS